MKVYDCFTFFNEVDLLEIRLNELNSIVDYFVLVESPKTFQNTDKQLYYLNNLNKFSKFNNKIIRLEIGTNNFSNNPWENEKLSWDYLINGLNGAQDEDLIMISALDEIPKKEVIEKIKNNNLLPCCVVMDLYYFYLNTKYAHNNSTKWNGTFVTQFKSLNKNSIYSFNSDRQHIPLKIEGGWHFSFLGDAKNAVKKVHSYSHSEFNHFSEEFYSEKIKNLEDVFGRRELKFDSFVELNTLPEYVQTNIENFKKYIRT